MWKVLLLSIIFPLEMVQAETVHLKNGEILRGQVETLAGDIFQLNTKYGRLNVLRDSILTIDFRPDDQRIEVDASKLSISPQTVKVPIKDNPPQQSNEELRGNSTVIKNGKYNSFKLGLDTSGTYDISASVGLYNVKIGGDVDSAVSVSYEYTAPVVPLINQSPFLGGAGVNFQFPRGFSGDDITFQFISGYLVGKIPISGDELFTPYIIGQVGAGLGILHGVDPNVDVTLKGGFYYGAGLELNSAAFGGTVLYSVNKGSLEVSDESFDVEYKKISISLSYSF